MLVPKGYVCVNHGVHIVESLSKVDPETAIIIASDTSENRLTASLKAASQMLALTDEDLKNPPYTDATDRARYVYAYFRNPEAPLLENSFYVGKGVCDRWLDHLRERLNATAGPATKPKHRPIDTWVTDQLKKMTKRELIAEATNNLVRKVGVWEGEYAEAQAFAAEYTLISIRLRVWDLTNDTGGNIATGDLRMVGRPIGLDMRAQCERALWEQVIIAFDNNPIANMLTSRLKPAMLLLHNFATVQTINEKAAKLQLTQLDVQSPTIRKLIGQLPSNFTIDGASDATVNFQAPAKLPIRVSLKLSFKNPAVRVNLRPIPGMRHSNEAFLSALKKCGWSGERLSSDSNVDFVIKRPDDPYFKPFARGGNGKNDTPFPIDGSQVLVDTNWLDKPTELSLFGALERFFQKA